MTQDEQDIRNLIERWSKAVRDQDHPGIRADHADDVLMFDVPPPFLSRSADMTASAEQTAQSMAMIWEFWRRRPGNILVPGHDLPM